MRRLFSPFAFLAVVLTVLARPADALTCYMLFDRSDNVVYRDTLSPVDLSEQGAAARAAMRQRGGYLMSMETDRCPQVSFVFGSGGSSTLSTEGFLGGLRPDGGTGATMSPPAPGPSGAPTGATPAVPPTRRTAATPATSK